MDPPEVPRWLKSLPLAPEYRPTETEFSDPIAFISRVERETADYGICKIIPPLPRPSKKFVYANLRRSVGSDDAAVFTTRHQEVGSRRVNKQVWQSGVAYTLEQFEAKAKAFAKARLGIGRDSSAMALESSFWKAVADKPVYIEYANDVPGSGFAPPQEVAGRNLSNSPWNLQVIARAPGSLTRFMPDEVPGVTSPMVYIGMLFSWFAWHVEDHELHSLNYLHTGAPKSWYAVPGEYASALEDVVHMQGYGGDVDRLAAFIMLGEKRTLISPEVLVASGIPCCRLVQHPGEFVVTFPKAYHVGFSHGFNCGEAANFATSKWLDVAKEAAVRRAAMSYLPMLSHQQLMYMLAVSFISRVPRAFLPGVRSSRLTDRKKEEREVLVKRAFIDDMISEENLLYSLLRKDSTIYAVFWDPDLLPSMCDKGPLQQSLMSCKQHELLVDKCNKEEFEVVSEDQESPILNIENEFLLSSAEAENPSTNECAKDEHDHNEKAACPTLYKEKDLPCGLDVDSGTLACVACGILGYPFMTILQPLDRKEESVATVVAPNKTIDNLKLRNTIVSSSDEDSVSVNQSILHSSRDMDSQLKDNLGENVLPCKAESNINNNSFPFMKEVPVIVSLGKNDLQMVDELNVCTTYIHEYVEENSNVTRASSRENAVVHDGLGANVVASKTITIGRWNTSNLILRPRTFCLQHALEVHELMQDKGGCSVLIICHSDYLKIKAQAISVAEEIGVHFTSTDIPIQNASKEDLNLINMSIDDEECEEDIEDWTSKLGLNLRNCVKLRKQSVAKQGELPLALRGLFSDPIHLSVSAHLKWHPRKSRSSTKASSIKKDRLADANCEEFRKPNKNLNCVSSKDQMDTTNENQQMYLEKEKSNCDQPIELSPLKLQCKDECAKANKDDIDQVTCSSSCKEYGHGELRSETHVFSPVFTPEKPINCKEFHEASVCGRAELPGDSTFPVKLGLEDKVSGFSDRVDASALAKDSSSAPHESSELHFGALSIKHWTNDDEFVKSEMHPKETHYEAKTGLALEYESTHIANKSDCTEMILESQTAATQQDNYSGIMNTGSADSGMDTEASDPVNYLIKPAKIKISESGQETTMALLHQMNHIGETERMAVVRDPYLAADASIKCYVRRKKPSDRSNLATNPETQACETHDIIPTIEKKANNQDSMNMSKSAVVHFDNGSNIKQSESSRKKRKREINQLASDHFDFGDFVRSPCESLRTRTGRTTYVINDNKRRNIRTKEANADEEYCCNIEGCRLKLRTKQELSLHRRNRCTYDGCGKRFSKHRYAMRHQRVHADERPLKCPWKGCTMSFKWAWARTEHLRLHTGERPYICKVTGCGLTFKFVSDYSRHRRKTGHYLDTSHS